MEELYVLYFNKNQSITLKNMQKAFCKSFYKINIVKNLDALDNLKHKKILIPMELNHLGVDFNLLSQLAKITKGDFFQDSTAAILVHSSSELFTKRATQDIIFYTNFLGLTFLGHPMVEATNTMKNLEKWSKNLSLSLEDTCIELSTRLGKRLKEYSIRTYTNPSILILYSSPNKFSNTLSLWYMVKKHLPKCNIQEIQIENGSTIDCRGCSYKTCSHLSKQKGCFYGGVITENVLPAIEDSDIIIWLCPNYNDSVAANLTAAINRLTALYHKIDFYDKAIFGIVVSGNSGSDSVCKQLIGALNINKGFFLPAYGFLHEIANDPHAIFSVIGIEEKSKKFAKEISKLFNK